MDATQLYAESKDGDSTEYQVPLRRDFVPGAQDPNYGKRKHKLFILDGRGGARL